MKKDVDRKKSTHIVPSEKDIFVCDSLRLLGKQSPYPLIFLLFFSLGMINPSHGFLHENQEGVVQHQTVILTSSFLLL